ncbi:YlbF family regulator [Natronomonas sp. EA1]|uniref:YlbF family regulator n=1 Tax=Natronomonas sp. EA1 TaxID=3421655 RepID=UPI003EBFB1BE
MSIETSAAATDAEESVSDLATKLGQAITETEEYQRYLEAKEAVESDEEAQEQVKTFESIREEFMLARQTGDATNEDLRELQSAQQELHELPVMREYLQAQSALELELQELNTLISDELVVDFGEKAGGCCQD